MRSKCNIISALLLFLTFAMLLFRNGGLQQSGSIFAILFVSIACLIKSCHIKINLNFLAVLLLTLFSFLSVVFTVCDVQVATYEFHKFLVFVFAFLYSSAGKTNINLLYFMIMAFAGLSAFAGSLCYIDLLSMDGFVFYDDFFGGIYRLQSFFTYANVDACFLLVGYICASKLFLDHKSKFLPYLSSFILISYFLTCSKGNIFLLFVLGSVFVFVAEEYRNLFVTQFVFSLITAVICVLIRSGEQTLPIIAILLAGTWVSGKYYNCIRLKKSVLIPLLALSFIGVLIIVYYIDPTFSTFMTRLRYARDSVPYMIENFSWRIFTGFGFGSWRVLQYSFQTCNYHTTFAHSSLLNFMFENGIIFCLLFGYLIIKGIYKSFRKKDYIVSFIVTYIFLHSLIDIDLSYSAILLILGIFTGIGCYEEQLFVAVFSKLLHIGLLIFTIVLNIGIFSDYVIRKNMENAYISGEYEDSLKYANMLEYICPRDSNLQLTAAAIYERLGEKDKMIDCLESAVEYSPYDPYLYSSLMLMKDDFSAYDDCLHILKLAPNSDYFKAFTEEYALKAKDKGVISSQQLELILDKIKKDRR